MLSREEQRDALEEDHTANATSDPPSSGWVAAQQQTQPCNEVGQRHSYKGGDVCLKCGQPKPGHQPRNAGSAIVERTPRATPDTVKMFRGSISMAWMALGIGCENLSVATHVAQPVGRTLQLEAPIAGTRIQKALSKTPAWKPILAMLRAVGPWADLLPLLAPPVIVGAIALAKDRPKLQEKLMPMAVGLLLPVMSEVSAMAEEQAELMSNMQKYNQEAISEALSVFGDLFAKDDDKQSPNGTVVNS